MAIAKEDIKEGFYWVRSRKDDWARDRKNGELSIVLIAKWSQGLVVLHPGYEVEDDDFELLDFIVRIEPPEGV
jgi:hypothetical protein